MKEKRGSAHFEMIIAFLFFLGFIVFLFVVLKPYDTQVLTDSVINGVFDAYSEEVNTEFVRFFLRTTNAPGATCHNATLPLELFNYELTESKVFDLDEAEVNSNINGDLIFIEDEEGYFYVYSSENFIDETPPCGSIGDVDPRIGSVVQKEIFSLKKMEDLEDRYNNGVTEYESVKQELGVPEIYDFTIEVKDAQIEMMRPIPETGDVIAKDFIVEILDEDNGKVINSRVTLTIW